MDTKAGDERQAVQYLLGELTEAEQSRLEERFFQDPALSELLSGAEDDLIDQYVREELSARERQRFENHFLVSERRHNKVVFARSWLQTEKQSVLSVAESESPVSWWGKMLAALRQPRPILAYSLAALAMMLLVSGLWQFSELRRLQNRVAEIETERDLRAGQEHWLRKQADDERQRNNELAAQKDKLEHDLASLKPRDELPDTEQRSAPSPLAFILSPGVRASEAPHDLVVPGSTQSLRLQLNLNPGDRYRGYRVTLQTASGSPVRSWNRLTALSTGAGLAVVITVPAKSLNTGKYELTLSGVAAPDRAEDLGYYYFNLQKR